MLAYLESGNGDVNLEVESSDENSNNRGNNIVHDHQAPVSLQVQEFSMTEDLELCKCSCYWFGVSSLYSCRAVHIAVPVRRVWGI